MKEKLVTLQGVLI